METLKSLLRHANQFLKSEEAPLYLWFSSFPLGIAAQNLVSVLVFSWAGYRWFTKSRTRTETCRNKLSVLIQSEKIFPSLFLTLWIIWTVIAGILNPQSRVDSLLRYPLGYLCISFAPLFFAVTCQSFSARQWERFFTYTSFLLLLWGIIALSQSFLGWRILGSQLSPDSGYRPRGLYSHPLTFAYAAFLFWPLSLQLVLFRRHDIRSWMMLISSGICLFLTESRTIQCVAIILVFVSFYWHFRGRLRQIMITALLLLIVLTFSTPNPLARKFQQTFSSEGLDLHSHYPDDRLAFWHAHWLMIQERPLTGHGFRLDTEYRLPYYEELGLKDFIKPYEAHNTYIQLWANSGIIGLSLFLLWILWHLKHFIRPLYGKFFVRTSTLTFSGILIASLTQNAFQDASVRMVLSMLLSACWIHMFATSPAPNSSDSFKNML